MKLNKIFTFKNIMFVFCVGIAIISTFFSCEVRAYTNDDLSDFVNQLLLNDNVNSTTRNRLGTFKNNENSLFTFMSNNNLNLSNYKGFACEFMSSDGDYNFYLIPNNVTATFDWKTYYIKSCDWIYRNKYGSFTLRSNYNSVVSIASNDAVAYYKYFGLTDGLFDNIHEFGNSNYFENYYTPVIRFDFSPYGFQLSGDSATYWNKFAYVSGFIPLGVLGSNSYFQLDIKLRDENGYDVGNYSDVPGFGSISDWNDKILKVENSVVYVNGIYLAYYRNYNLLFKVWDNSNDFETYIYSYEFMPFSAVIENGVIVSSGDTTFSGGDATILITDNLNDYSDVYNILSIFGSGDFFSSGDEFSVSGDLFTLLGYSDYDNDYKDFVYNGIYHNLKDVFLSSNDREFTFLFMDRIITINSNSFTTPNGVLKTFVSSFLVFGTIYYFYKTTIHFYHKMQEGNQLEAVETWSVDDESILM